MTLDRDTLFIGGWAKPATSALIEVVSPHSEEIVARVPEGSTADVDAAVTVARKAFDEGPWPLLSPQERIDIVQAFSTLYLDKLTEMAEIITTEMGSTISFSNLAQAPAAWMQIEAFLAIAREFPWEGTRPGAMGTDIIVRHEPVGVVAAIPPWNVPQFTLMSKVIPALLTGCTVVAKPAPESPLDGYLMAELLQQAGVPDGVVNIVAAGREVGEHLVRHPGIDKVAFTGSTAAGRKIAAICGEQLKRVSLELGGKSAAIVLDDADQAAAIEGIKFIGLMNSGQACVATTRILVSRERHDEFSSALAESVGAMVVGDPADARSEIGPMVAQRQQERVEGYIKLGEQEGAKLLTGGPGRPDGLATGWYVKPTVFANVDNRSRIAQEEIFGPVLSVIPYDGIDDAVRLANESEYGLAGTVWTSDQDAGLGVARRIRTGTFGVNTYTMDMAGPFGGFKKSGIGREFGPEGLAQYAESKSVYLPPALG